MYKIRPRTHPSHPILKGPENLFDDLIKEVCGIKTEEEWNKSIDTILEWAKQQNHFVVKDLDRGYVEGFLYGCKGSLEVTKQYMDKRFTQTTLMPEMLTNIDMNGGFKDLFSYYMFVAMPISKDKFYRINVNKFYGSTEKMNVNDLFKFWMAGMEYHLMNDASIGAECIFDFEEANLTDFLLKFTPTQMNNALSITMKGYRMKIKKLHVLSGSKVVDVLIAMLKSVLSAKLSSRIQVHNCKESLVESVGKEYLPSDYGGTQKPLAELHELYYSHLCSEQHQRHLAMVETYRTDESLRLSTSTNAEYSGMPGSFRALSID